MPKKPAQGKDIHVRIPDRMYESLLDLSVNEERTIAEIVRDAIRARLREAE